MKTKTKKELHEKSVEDLNKQLKEISESYRILKLDHELGKLKNTSSLSETRGEIAIIKTIISEKLAAERLVAEKTAEAEGEKVKPVSAKAIAGKGGKK